MGHQSRLVGHLVGHGQYLRCNSGALFTRQRDGVPESRLLTLLSGCGILAVVALDLLSLTVRDVTERPETIEAASNMLAWVHKDGVLRAIAVALSSPPEWEPPAGYLDRNLATTVVKIVLSGAGE